MSKLEELVVKLYRTPLHPFLSPPAPMPSAPACAECSDYCAEEGDLFFRTGVQTAPGSSSPSTECVSASVEEVKCNRSAHYI